MTEFYSLFRSGKKISVVLGAHKISKKEASQQLIEVAKYFPHPDFKPKGFDNDIMLLKVSANIQHDSKNYLKSINQLASKGNILHFAASLIHFRLLSVELTHRRLTFLLKVAVKCDSKEVCISTAILCIENSLTEEKLINSSTLFLLIFSYRRKPN